VWNNVLQAEYDAEARLEANLVVSVHYPNQFAEAAHNHPNEFQSTLAEDYAT